MPEKWTSTERPWKQGCFVWVEQYKMAEHFTHFTHKEIAKLLQMYLKNIARTARKQPDGRHLLVEITIHCTHYLSSHWLRAYSKFILEIGASYRLVSYLLADN